LTSNVFLRFVRSEQAGGLLLLACTLAALALANSPWDAQYAGIRHQTLGPLTLEHWINDGLMAVFFLLVGLELEREIYVGELSAPRKALLPLLAAIGGMLVPAGIHVAFNAGLPTTRGFGIPMATDIAFALAVLAALGTRTPTALKVFVVAFAVADDLGAVLVIAAAYTTSLSLPFLAGAAGAFAALVALNRIFRVMALWPYLLGGIVLWACLLNGGVHASIAGVLLAFAIPFSPRADVRASPSHRLEQWLHAPVAFVVLPLFALANTAIAIDTGALAALLHPNSVGIAFGLVAGKPLGITLFCWIAVRSRLCALPEGLGWRHVLGAGMLGGIGFTMSIFISNLAFAGDPSQVESSKLAVLFASTIAAAGGFAWLRARA
jgi:NhaA family Na+:H+ antiporter